MLACARCFFALSVVSLHSCSVEREFRSALRLVSLARRDGAAVTTPVFGGSIRSKPILAVPSQGPRLLNASASFPRPLLDDDVTVIVNRVDRECVAVRRAMDNEDACKMSEKRPRSVRKMLSKVFHVSSLVSNLRGKIGVRGSAERRERREAHLLAFCTLILSVLSVNFLRANAQKLQSRRGDGDSLSSTFIPYVTLASGLRSLFRARGKSTYIYPYHHRE